MPRNKEPRGIAAMFSAIAPRYDLLNHLLSCGLDRYWRRVAVAVVAAERPERVLDLCAGTGDLSRAVLRRHTPLPQVVLADFALPMLARARPKFADGEPVTPLVADGLRLPFVEQSFDAVMSAFGVRNFVELETGLRQAVGVLRVGGTLTVLEFCGWQERPLPAPLTWFIGRIVPLFGRWLSGHASAYHYLQDSIAGFVSRGEMTELFERIGLTGVRARDLSFGICTVITGRKAGLS